MNKFPYKLPAINKMLQLEGLPEIKKQRIKYLIKSGKLKLGLHYMSEHSNKRTFYFYSDEAVKWFRDWAIQQKQKAINGKSN